MLQNIPTTRSDLKQLETPDAVVKILECLTTDGEKAEDRKAL